jgi:hypothetical protein
LEGGAWQLGVLLDHSGHGGVRSHEQQHERDADGEGEVFHLSTARRGQHSQGAARGKDAAGISARPACMGSEHSSAMMSLDVPGTVHGWRDAAVDLDSRSADHV